MLVLEERQLLSEEDRPLMRIIQAGERIFTAGVVEWVLRKGHGVPGAEGTEYLAYVIDSLADRVRGPQRQLFEQVIAAEFHLQRVVVGKAGVRALTQHSKTAMRAAQVRGDGASRRRCNLWGGAGRHARRNQVGK